uniref:Uncharacterized protein n=1 Tax=Rhizophora mucronata TaxID=61149 RepID=A0A2P2Q816_RHIMU
MFQANIPIFFLGTDSGIFSLNPFFYCEDKRVLLQ